ncbi:hypothetical protein C1H46_043858 [Malus baccata]|uniref:Uncharacterized protein n=1 Tax=Malus baccata TaxID=106549 RepID=A0A540K8Q8_MALBA|nr:hypothetical protein C1H46_043858 [Malus baccata]
MLCASKFRQPHRRSDIVKTATKRPIEEGEAIEGLPEEWLIREFGGSWQSSLSQRNSSKGGRGRWRKRMGTPTPSTNVDEVSQPQIEQPKCEELQGPEERNVTCWGKRTRRPPRQIYPIDNSPVPQK